MKTFIFIFVLCCFTCAEARFSPEDIKLLTFDFYAALMNSFDSIENDTQKVLEGHFPSQTIQQLISSWVSQYSSLIQINSLQDNPQVKWSQNELFTLMLNTTLNVALQSMNLSLPSDLFAAVLKTWTQLRPWPNTLSTLLHLRNATTKEGKPRFQLGILSNGDLPGLTTAVQVLLPFKFDYLLCSTTAGQYFKPSPKFYDQVLKVQPNISEMVHVAGAGFDALGAKVYGLNVIWNNHLDDIFINLTGNKIYEPDYVIDDISGVLGIFGVNYKREEFTSTKAFSLGYKLSPLSLQI